MDPSRIRGMSVQNVMTKEVVTVRADERIRTAWMTLMEHNISGAPVVDGSGSIVGILSMTDIYRSILERSRKARALREATAGTANEEVEEKEGTRELTIAMRAVTESSVSGILPVGQTVHQLGPLDSLERAVKLLAEEGVNRLPVVKNGKVVGIISRQDVICILAGRSSRCQTQ